jgi:hypothetical protein
MSAACLLNLPSIKPVSALVDSSFKRRAEDVFLASHRLNSGDGFGASF